MKINNKYCIYGGVQLVSILLTVSVAFSAANQGVNKPPSKSKSMEEKTVREHKTQGSQAKYISKQTTLRAFQHAKNLKSVKHARVKRSAGVSEQYKKKTMKVSGQGNLAKTKMSSQTTKMAGIPKQNKRTVTEVSKRPPKGALKMYERSKKEIQKKSRRAGKIVTLKKTLAHKSRVKAVDISQTTLVPEKPRRESRTKSYGKGALIEPHLRSKPGKPHLNHAAVDGGKGGENNDKSRGKALTVASIPVTEINNTQARMVKRTGTAMMAKLNADQASKATPIYQQDETYRKIDTARQVKIVRASDSFDKSKHARQSLLAEVPFDESHWSEKVGALFAESAVREFEDPTKNRMGLGEMPTAGDPRVTKPDVISGETGWSSGVGRAQAMADQKDNLLDRLSTPDLGRDHNSKGSWYQGLNANVQAPGERRDTRDQSRQDHDTLIHAVGGKTLNDAAAEHKPAGNPSSSDPNYSGTETDEQWEDTTGTETDDGIVFDSIEVKVENDDGLVRNWPMTNAGKDELVGDLRQGGYGNAWKEGSVGFALGCFVADLIWPTYSVTFSEDEVEPVVGENNNGWDKMPNPDDAGGGHRDDDPQAILAEWQKHSGQGTISQPPPGEEGGKRIYGEIDPSGAVNRAKQRRQWASMPTEDDPRENAPQEEGEIPELPDTGDPPDPDLQ